MYKTRHMESRKGENSPSVTCAGKFLSYLDPVRVISITDILHPGFTLCCAGVRNIPPGAVGGQYGSGCFHVCSSFSVSLKRACVAIGSSQPSCLAGWGPLSSSIALSLQLTLCFRVSVMCRFASNRDRMYRAWPRQRCRWTAQSSDSFSERR